MSVSLKHVAPASINELALTRPTLAGFALNDLAGFKAGGFLPGESGEYRSFYVGRDDVHGVMCYLLSRCSRSLKFNMYGYDDPALDQIIRTLIDDDAVFVQGTLDRSQAAGAAERKLLQAWEPKVRASFAIGESATHQISHTKGGVIDGLIAFEGSTNWSAGGEGVGIVLGQDAKQAPGFKAQNNTLLVHINPVEVQQFALELDEEHTTCLQQAAGAATRSAS